jgi:uncharacterized protein
MVPDTQPLDLQPLDRRVRTLWWVVGALSVVPPTVAAAIFGALAPIGIGRDVLVAAVAVGGLVLAAVVPVIRYRRWGYMLRDRDFVIRKGVIWVTVSIIPYARLQFVDTRQGPLDRLFGLSQLVVHTASLGMSGRLPGLDADVAEDLRERLAAVETDVVTV